MMGTRDRAVMIEIRVVADLVRRQAITFRGPSQAPFFLAAP